MSCSTTLHISTAPYDSCTKCHTGLADKHNINIVTFKEFPVTDIGNDFCSDCHTEQYTSFQDANHTSQNCVNCHAEHKKLQVEFENCVFCHTDIPTNHDATTTGCSACHGTEVIHS